MAVNDAWPKPPTAGTAPGWRTDPNRANDSWYWDGQTWTGRRRWTATGFVELPMGPAPDEPKAAKPTATTKRHGLDIRSVVIAVVVVALAAVAVALITRYATTSSTSPQTSTPGAVSPLVWAAPVAVDPAARHTVSGQLEYVSCPSASFCMVVGGDGKATSFDGHSWTRAVSIDRTASIHAVSCPSSGFCLAVGGNANGGFVVTYRGGVWGRRTDLVGPQPVAVTCTSDRFCVVVGNGLLRTYDGTRWSSSTTSPSRIALRTVACESATFCLATSPRNAATEYDGHLWSLPTYLHVNRTGKRGDDNAIVSMSCPAAGFCMATDAEGNAYRYRDHSWSSGSIDTALASNANQSALGMAFDVQPTSVSCTSTSFCVAVDALGNAMTYDGNAWSSPVKVDPAADLRTGATLDSVACASPTFCVAVDSSGNALIATGR